MHSTTCQSDTALVPLGQPHHSLNVDSLSLTCGSDPLSDTHFIVLPSLKVFDAFCRIAVLLDIQCSYLDGFHVRASPQSLPPSLAPTANQMLIPHKTFADTLPWPSLRERLLASLAVVDELEFINDLHSCRIWGAVPWSPTSWEIGEGLARKWWFLMDDEILATSNFWRAQRGEKLLIMDDLKRMDGPSTTLVS